jgi:glycosyltransferase involved in cell wall biosynthesis
LHPVDAGEAATTAARLVGSAAPYLLFVGKMSGRRRAPLLVESFAAFRQATGAPHLLVMAGPPPEPEVGETADRLGVGELVRHLGFVDDHDLNVLYNGAAAVVCPSVYENVSLPIMEAQATGRPVVCVDAPGAREITAGAAVFMPRLDVASLVAAIRRVVEDPALAAELGDAGLANSRQYSWDRTAAETITVLADAGA